MDGSDSWLIKYEACEHLSREIVQNLAERNQSQNDSARYTRLSANIRQSLTVFSADLSALQNRLPSTTFTSKNITQREVERRQRLLDDLTSKQRQFEEAFQSRSAGMDNRLSLFGQGNPSGSRINPFMEDDDEIRNLDPSQIRQFQQQTIREQDAGLEALAKVVARQKNIAGAIGDEVDYQNELIDDIHDHVERADQRLITETRHVKLVDRKSNTCCYWVIVVLLFVAIIVVAVVPYKGKA